MYSLLRSIKTPITSRSRAFIEQAKLGDKVSALRNVSIIYIEDLRAQVSLADKLWLVLWALRFPRWVNIYVLRL